MLDLHHLGLQTVWEGQACLDMVLEECLQGRVLEDPECHLEQVLEDPEECRLVQDLEECRLEQDLECNLEVLACHLEVLACLLEDVECRLEDPKFLECLRMVLVCHEVDQACLEAQGCPQMDLACSLEHLVAAWPLAKVYLLEDSQCHLEDQE